MFFKKKDFVSFLFRLKAKEERHRSRSSSTSSDSTLVFVDKETQEMVTYALKKLSKMRPLREQVILTNAVSLFYPCPFIEREFMQLYRTEKQPRGKREIASIPLDVEKTPFQKRAVEFTAKVVLTSKRQFNSISVKTSRLLSLNFHRRRQGRSHSVHEDHPLPFLRRRRSDVINVGELLIAEK